MRKKIVGLVIVLIVICIGYFGFGSKEILMKDIVTKPESITEITVRDWYTQQDWIKITSSKDLTATLNIIMEIRLTKLSVSQEKNFMGNVKPKDQIVLVELLNQIGTEQRIMGSFLIWPNGSIIAFEPKTITATKRTKSYSSISKYPELYRLLINKKTK